MRVTDNAMIRDFLAGISLTRQRLNKLQLQLATERRVSKPSDDPEATSIILRADMELGKLTKFRDTISAGKSLLQASSSGLDQVASILQNVKGALAGAQGQTEPAQLGRLADQVNSYLDMALEIGNTEYDRKYIFGGTKTTGPPFVISGSPQQVLYNGNAAPVEYQIGAGMTQQVSIPGSAAFASTGVAALAGTLDRNATVGSSVSNTLTITDGMGISHAVQLTFEKTAANTWKVSSAMPPGTTDASVAGGTAIIAFDPVTGNMTESSRGAPLMLTPAVVPPATRAASPIAVMLSANGLTEQTGSPATSAAYSGVNMFNKLIEIRDGLRIGRMPSSDDVALIGMMNEAVTREGARAGTYASALDNADSYHLGLRERLLDIKGSKQDIDLAEIGIQLKVEQTALDAALSAAARIIPRSLLDFLK